MMMISLIDNQAGLAALTKGYGKDPCINNLLALTWRLIGHFRWQIHWEWVRSELNIADSVSRFDFQHMERLGAQHVEYRLDPLFRLLVRVASNSACAHGAALPDLLALQTCCFDSTRALAGR